jgi:glycosyltransferase involved in cell wall biosynthesis
MKINLYVSAIYISTPNTMGGNTKILLELINNLNNFYNFIVFTSEPETFKKNIKNINSITLIEIPYNFKKLNYFSHLKEIDYLYNYYKQYFNRNKIGKNDYFYSASDFGPDVLPIYKLKKEYDFKWIASLYLFIPSPFENLIENYKFPFLKYIIYYFYQQYLFKKILEKYDLCLITNHYDKKYFPKNQAGRCLPVYGGVNIEQIERASKGITTKKYDAIYCSRLHPQKGISQLLDIWKLVLSDKKNAKLAVIGNGGIEFERLLKDKSRKLNIEKNIYWLGYVNNEAKYKLYLQSKFFVHPAIYDNNGMVVAEALCSGLPVVMYDSDSRKFYDDGCIKIKINDQIQYSKEILRLIKDKKYYNKIKPSFEMVKELKKLWKWKNRANIFKKFLEDYEKNIT